VEKDCTARGLNREDAMDRSRWRKQIEMIDDHDECEWVNVSSGTGSPGLSWTKWLCCACVCYVSMVYAIFVCPSVCCGCSVPAVE